MSHKQITIKDRIVIFKMICNHISNKNIAIAIGKDKSSISREIKRCRSRENYDPYTAQMYADDKREIASFKRWKLHKLENREFVEYMNINMSRKVPWSVDDCIGRWKYEKGYAVCTTKTAYNFIEEGDIGLGLNKKMLRKYKVKKGPKPSYTKGNIPNMISISKRPENANNRIEFGHIESDSVIGSGKSNLNTALERKTRHLNIFKINDGHTKHTHNANKKLLSTSIGKHVKSITYDRGKENNMHHLLRKSHGINTYHCHAYSSHEKGSNENCNGIIRRFFPKGTNFDNITEEEIYEIQEGINNKPRKILNYKTPNEQAKIESCI